jgi:hypothetical protein
VHDEYVANLLFFLFLVTGTGICSSGFIWSVEDFSNPERLIASRMMLARISSSADVACMPCALSLDESQFTAPRHRILLGFKKRHLKKKIRKT